MNRQQKIAWFNLIVIAVVFTAAAITIGILNAVVGMPRALAGLGLMGFIGTLGFAPLIFKAKKGQVDFDERDQIIQRKASVVAYSVFWLTFVAGGMIPWLILGPVLIPLTVLPMMVGAGGILVVLVQAVATLIQYGQADRNVGKENDYE